MFFSKSVQLFCVSILSLTLYTQARSITVMGDVKIVRTDDKWQCDRIQCPLNANRCIVTKSNEESPSVLRRVNTCYSDSDEILVQKIFTSPADPNTVIRQKITSVRNGAISSTSNFNASDVDFDEEKFNEDLNRQLTDMQSNIHSQMSGLNRGLENNMKNLHDNLNKMNQNINSNVQGQMSNLQANLNRMQYRLAHMFD